MSTEMDRLQRLADRLRTVTPVDPGPAGRIRAWNLVSASLTVRPAAAPRPRAWPSLRLAGALAGAVAVLVLGAVTAAAQSLPNSPLYSVKRFDENVRAALTVGTTARFDYRLELADTRLVEAQAMIEQDRLDLAEAALESYDADLAEAAALAAEAGSPAATDLLETRLERAIAVHDAQLQGLQGEVTNPVARAAIQAARDRALSTAPAGQLNPKPSHSPRSSNRP
jgi:hypothetical protein